MKRFFACIMAISFSQLTFAVTDVYDIRATLSVPQVVSNSDSLGKRVRQSQVLFGHLAITYEDGMLPSISFTDLTNKTFKIDRKCIGYDVEVDECDMPRVQLIGNNKTGEFRNSSIYFRVIAEPDYIPVGKEPDEDNSFVLSFAGHGKTALAPKGWRSAEHPSFRVISSCAGKVTGTQGCGCTVYGHKSPTRVAGPFGPSDFVVDVADVTGTWSMKLNKKLSRLD